MNYFSACTKDNPKTIDFSALLTIENNIKITYLILEK